jgi:HK97 family phage major capsid protein
VDLIKQLRERRAIMLARIRELVDAAERRGSDLTPLESQEFNSVKRNIDELDERIAFLEAEEAREERAGAAAARVGRETSGPGARAGVGMTYRAEELDRFVSDAYRAEFQRDPEAIERIQRHRREMAEEYRAIGTGAVTGLIVPQYLVELYAPKARAGRAFIDSIRNLPLPPDGMTVNISRLTTGTAVAAQASEGAVVQNTDADDTLLTIDVRTYAGQQIISRQALERGEVEPVLLADLVSAYHTTLDAACITGAGSSGTHKGILAASGTNAVTYTDGTPTAAELWPKIADAISQVNGAHFPADLIVMHPRRWSWLNAAVDSQLRPLVVPMAGAGPTNAHGLVSAPGEVGRAVGFLQGLPVVTSANIPTNLGAGTNEDVILVLSSQEAMLWEAPGSPLELRFEEVADVATGAQLQVGLVVYGYSAFTAERQPTAISKIGGTGLVAPTF